MTRRLVYIINPAAGHGRYLAAARAQAEDAHADAVHLTERARDCEDFVTETCLADPDTHFVVYGGDGTAGEAANGIMRAGAGRRALFTSVACGSGNDFARGIAAFPPPPGAEFREIDLVSVNGRYVLNMLNIGFDCDVVAASEQMRRRRFVPNGLSYILGVAGVLARKSAFAGEIELDGVARAGEDALTTERLTGSFLLCAVANLPYCGGGFKAAAAADPSDGFLDVLIVHDVTRRRFVSLVGGYHDGTHIHAETWTPYPQYRGVLDYRRCRALTLTGVTRICLDGEVIPASGVRAEIVPRALRYTPSLV